MQLKDLLELIEGGVEKTDLPPRWADGTAKYAARVWEGCLLPGPIPSESEYTIRSRTGAKILCHFPTIREGCFLVVVLDDGTGEPEDHLPYDIGGQYRPPVYRDLSTEIEGTAQESRIASSLLDLGKFGTPAAILEFGEGSYLQTWRDGPDEYDLEYQLVTTAFHYVVSRKLRQDEVVWAFLSCANGRYEWAKDFPWILHSMSL